jgi:murein DD-endopeptidase MepM/ murein hydrolase activator NlpD
VRPGVVGAVLLALVFPAAAEAHTDAGWQVSLRWPAEGTITSPFGRDGYRWHPGLDIGILHSLDVGAAADGVVTSTGFVQGFDGYGEVVAIRHRYGYTTVYAHLARALVHPGQVVEQGELVGEAGCTGWCTGTHLHFELRHEDLPVDPTLLMLG